MEEQVSNYFLVLIKCCIMLGYLTTSDILATVIALFRWPLQGNEYGAVRLGSARHGTARRKHRFPYCCVAYSVARCLPVGA
jgi:hypothetical protein